MGERILTADGIAAWKRDPIGAFELQIVATDAAGNESTATVPLRTSTFVEQLAEARAEVEILYNQNGASQPLDNAINSLDVAHSYATMTRPYVDGAYLRVDNAVEYLFEAADYGIDIGWTPQRLARALWASIDRDVKAFDAGALPEDQAIVNDGLAYSGDAYFELYRPSYGDVIALSRSARDVTMLLDPSLASMRLALRSAQDRWSTGVVEYAGGNQSSEGLRLDQPRFLRIFALMTQIRDALGSTLYPEVIETLGNQFTSQRQLLEEIADVIDKLPGEEGDLVAVTDPTVNDACVDLLTTLELDDRTFTLCYLRVNDLARFMDSVSEPLVPTGRWRTSLGLALFNLLELSLYLSPTGLPWVTSPFDTSLADPPPLVLPDAEAALVPGSVPVSQVDFADGLLASTYARYAEARGLLESGDTDGAWSIFVDERCLLLGVYNRYYSDQRTVTNVADPKEAPIDPAGAGCPP